MNTDNKTDLRKPESSGIPLKNNSDKHVQFNFKTQPAPANQPERNDHYWPEIYDIRKHDFEITIKPVESPYWRFGFRYSKTEDFPPNTEPRHSNKDIVDIHICVGDMRPNRKWHNANKVFLQSYHIPNKPNPRIIEAKYGGEEIKFIARWNPKTSQVYYELTSDGRILYQNVFKMDNFNFCMFGGWSDFNNYVLSTDIGVSSSK